MHESDLVVREFTPLRMFILPALFFYQNPPSPTAARASSRLHFYFPLVILSLMIYAIYISRSATGAPQPLSFFYIYFLSFVARKKNEKEFLRLYIPT